MKSPFVPQRKNLRVAWRTSAFIRVMRDLRVVKAVTRNVSVHGALLFTDEELPVGTPVQVALDLGQPGAPTENLGWPIEVRGKVARSDVSSTRTVAVTFEDPTPEQSVALRAAVFDQAMRLMERISSFPAFWDLSDLDQLALTTVCHEVRMDAGEQLARLGDEATSLFLVKSGRVRLCAPYSGDGGRRSEVEIAHAGQVFGEVSALLDLPHNLDIIAESDTELLVIPRDSIHFLREYNPNLALALYEIFAGFMGRRLRKMTTRVFSPLSC